MRRALQILAVMAFAAFCTGALAADEKVTLAYKAVQGQTARYKSEGTMTIEGGGQKFGMEMKEVEKVTFTEVKPDGTITMERESESSEAVVNGRKAPPREDHSKSIVIIKKDGTLVSYKITGKSDGDDEKMQARLFVANNPIFTEKPVGPGDKWAHDYKADADLGLKTGHADYEVLAFEKSTGVDSVKIKMTYKETEGTPALTMTSTIWVEKVSGDAVAAESDVANLDMGMGGTMGGKVRGERLSGAPMGGGKPAEAVAAAPKKDKTIDETIKDYEKVPGLFTLYKKKEFGRETIYMEIKEDQLNKLHMMEVTASTGSGTTNQIAAGTPINDILFKFVQRADERVLLVTPNIAFRGPTNTPIEKALKRSFPDGYLDSYKIEAKQLDRKSLLINVSELFRGDIAQISAALNGGGLLGGARGGGFGMDREKTYISAIKNFPDNLVVHTSYHFMGSGAMSLATLINGSTLADPRSLPLDVVYNVFPIPDNGYRPRLADPRVGYFLTDFQDFTTDNQEDQKIRYIYRWDLQKADPKAAMSKPKKPIVFWLDNAIPNEYRPAVREGILRWNKAFEKIGIQDAIVVNQMPDNADWDHADMRYNTIRWVTSPNDGYAVALFRVNPINGQILNANITVDSNLVRVFKLERKLSVEPSAYFNDPDPATLLASAADPRKCQFGAGAMDQAWFGAMALDMLRAANVKINEKSYINSFISMVVSHEFGHCLGLRHNFVASTYHSLDELKNEDLLQRTGVSGSVMDYTAFNIAAIKTPGVDFFQTNVGPYDNWAIQYGYIPVPQATTPTGELYTLKQIAAKCNEPGHAYQSDEVADQVDPLVTRWDLSKNPLDYWTKNLQVSRYLMLNLAKREPKKGESYWEFTRDFNQLLGLYSRAAAIASRYIGGVHLNRNHRGDPGEKPTLSPTTVDEQRRALNILTAYIFDENAFKFPTEYYGKMTTNPNEMDIMAILTGNGGADIPVRDQMASIQRAALNRMFSPSVLRRVSNNEFKTSDASKALTLPELFHTLSTAVWSELDGGRNVSSLRRQLQRQYVDAMIDMSVKSSSAPEDAKMLAWDQLRNLKSRIQQASAAKHDTYTRVHLDESLMRISRALEAKQMIGSSAPSGGGASLMSLLGGEGAKP